MFRYVAVVARTTWAEARVRCLALNGDLASIPDTVHFHNATGVLSASNGGIGLYEAWIGLSDDGGNNRFMWSDGSGGTDGGFSAWYVLSIDRTPIPPPPAPPPPPPPPPHHHHHHHHVADDAGASTISRCLARPVSFEVDFGSQLDTSDLTKPHGPAPPPPLLPFPLHPSLSNPLPSAPAPSLP